jgi:hypothetical protein
MKTTDLTTPVSAQKLNETMYKKFGVKVNFENYSREELENYRNLLRTKIHQHEAKSNFNDLLTNETYQKDKALVGLLNQKIKEMLGESKAKEGNAFGKAVRDAKSDGVQKGEKVKVGGKTYPVKEASKPDFLDMDKDGDKKEPMKKAVKDKKAGPKKGVNPFAKKEVDEGVAGPKKCWPGHKKVGTQPGTGKNAGKRVNDCEKIKEGRNREDDWDEGNTEPPNNFAIYINGKKWKVFPGPYGAYADSPEERREFQRLKDMAERKSQQTGKKWEVYITGEPATR